MGTARFSESSAESILMGTGLFVYHAESDPDSRRVDQRDSTERRVELRTSQDNNLSTWREYLSLSLAFLHMVSETH